MLDVKEVIQNLKQEVCSSPDYNGIAYIFIFFIYFFISIDM